MKFIHLSDLHLGKRVCGFSMLEDQRYILEQILELILQERADGVLLAGDIYDKPVPPAEAVQLLDWFLTSLAQKEVPVFLISGNHDSAERTAFGARLMESRGIHISPVYDGRIEPVCLQDEWGEVRVYLLPYLRPAAVRHAFAQEAKAGEIESCQEAVEMAVRHMELDTDKRNILVAHQFVAGALRCESEELLVGGLDQVDASVFEEFDYVALGHLHSPQKAGRPEVRYCGTPLKYSFSEAEQVKSVTLVELKEKGNVEIWTRPLRPLRDMRRVRGDYLEVTARDFYRGFSAEDYIQITLTDEEDIPDGFAKLRIIYPNLMQLEYDNRRTRENRQVEAAAAEEKSELELVAEFYELQNNQELSEQQAALVGRLLEELKE